jgi:endonuclease/exonuclease/phosphatase family metal-dependent hydrolase
MPCSQARIQGTHMTRLIAAVSIFRLFGLLTEPSLTDTQIHQIAQGSAPSVTTPVMPGQLKVVTWNIERGVRFIGILSTLKRLEPDVILLQEVDRFADRSGKRDVANDLAHELGMHWATAGEFQEIGQGGRGRSATINQAILSRFPILNPQMIVFSRQARWKWRLNPLQPRRGGRVAIRAETAGVTFFNLHLESGDSDPIRRDQLEQVLRSLGSSSSTVTILGGDLNTGANARVALLQRMTEAGFVDTLGPVGSRRTSSKYVQPVDWIFASGAGHVDGRVEVVQDVSDHYPLVSTIAVSPK